MARAYGFGKSIEKSLQITDWKPIVAVLSHTAALRKGISSWQAAEKCGLK
jgi:hypothetical protein